MAQQPSNRVVIGKITTVYGVKGWVKVHSFTEPMENFLSYTSCWVGSEQSWKPIEFDAGRSHGKGLVAHIAGVDDRELARSYTGSLVAVEIDQLPPLEDDEEYYWYQLEGLKVFTETEAGTQLLGKVSHLMETGANDVLVVRKCAGSIDRRERLIPYLPEQVVTSIDLESGEMLVDWDPEF